MRTFGVWSIFLAACLLLIGLYAPQDRAAAVDDLHRAPVVEAAPPPVVAPPPPVAVADVMADGVLIVVSKASQRMTVFKDGQLWRSSPVSTGKRGHGTPSGVFAILQKKTFHRSNLYRNAPMPYMQRLTWTGIAIHAGHVPGYPASHGCIRLPREFARSLYNLTRFDATAVIVTDEPLATDQAAFQLAAATDAAVPMDARFRERRFARLNGLPAVKPTPVIPPAPVLASAAPVPVAKAGGGQTIQLAAALSPAEASAHWSNLLRARPELAQMRQAIVPAIVANKQYYRLRASAPNAHAVCRGLKQSGFDCFAVT